MYKWGILGIGANLSTKYIYVSYMVTHKAQRQLYTVFLMLLCMKQFQGVESPLVASCQCSKHFWFRALKISDFCHRGHNKIRKYKNCYVWQVYGSLTTFFCIFLCLMIYIIKKYGVKQRNTGVGLKCLLPCCQNCEDYAWSWLKHLESIITHKSTMTFKTWEPVKRVGNLLSW